MAADCAVSGRNGDIHIQQNKNRETQILLASVEMKHVNCQIVPFPFRFQLRFQSLRFGIDTALGETQKTRAKLVVVAASAAVGLSFFLSRATLIWMDNSFEVLRAPSEQDDFFSQPLQRWSENETKAGKEAEWFDN